MAINPALLIAAPMLQDYIVDKSTGGPLVGGIVTCYQDNSRTTLKNWYYQSGVPNAYTYITLPNPMTLSGVGTIVDVNGNDTIPFFYPYDENSDDPANSPQPYYITVYSAEGQLQFTRENFPFIPSIGPTPIESIPTLQNIIVNSGFWRNIGSLTATNLISTSLLPKDIILAPSQHDGFSMPDIQFFKDVAGAVDTLTFNKFLPGQFLDQLDNPQNQDVTPEFYLNASCTGAGTENFKYVQIPISLHVKTLETTQTTFTIWARSNAGSPNTLTVSVLQFLGTGATSPPPIVEQTLTLSTTFQKYLVHITFPPASSTVGLGNDDALYIQIGYPPGTTFNIDIAKPCLYIGSTVPTDTFSTYDVVDTVINSPRTGDIRTSLNFFQPFGWIAANDGSIGTPSSNSTGRANFDTWQLYNLIWNKVLNNWAPTQDSSGAPVLRGPNAYSDFSANRRLLLTRNLGRVLAGLNPVFSTPINFTASSTTSILTVAVTVPPSTFNFTVGTPVQLTNNGGALPAPLLVNTVYFISKTSLSSTTVKLSTTVEHAYSGTDITLTTNGTGTNTLNPAIGMYVGESDHVLSVGELASHVHGGVNGPFVFNGPASSVFSAGPFGYLSPNTAPEGGNEGHNTIQPTTYLNVFIKL